MGAAMTCAVCAEVGDGVEACDEDPAVVARLVAPNLELERYFSRYDERPLLKCPGCESYFRTSYRTPGGSDDFQRTYVYHGVEPIGLASALLWLRSELERRRRDAADHPELPSYVARPGQLAPGVAREAEALRQRAPALLADALTLVEAARGSDRAWLRVRAERAAALIVEYLPDAAPLASALRRRIEQACAQADPKVQELLGPALA